MKNGTVISYNGAPGRRFGFIKPANGTENVFFHYSAVSDGLDLAVGQTVRYASIRGPKGPQATLVTYKKAEEKRYIVVPADGYGYFVVDTTVEEDGETPSDVYGTTSYQDAVDHAARLNKIPWKA